MPSPLDIEDAAQLARYLAELPAARGREYEAAVLAGGVSNRTVLVRFDDGEGWVIKQALPKLRVALDWYCDPARIHREALALRHLQGLVPDGATPRLVFEDEPRHLLAMTAVPEPHENWKVLLLAGQVVDDHVVQFASILSALQCRALADAPRLAAVFDDRSYFHDLRLEAYYAYTATQVPAAADFLQRLIADSLANRLTLVHGDYSPKNILVHAGRLVLLDHEVIHWGEPAFDLGFALTHLLSKAHHLATFRPLLVRAARRFWEVYRTAIAGSILDRADLPERVVRHTLGCLLARVAGRSPLEYLTPANRQTQRETIVALLRRLPADPDALIQAFAAHLP